MAQKGYGTVNRPLSDMLNEIYLGRLGLPDLQRPFVWSNAKVRDLFDSLMKGFPVGYFMTWQFPDDYKDVRQIGTNEKNYEEPLSVVIDGQQRLTALLSVIYGVEVYDASYQPCKIKISYNPFDRHFEVWSGAIDKDSRFIPDISEVFIAAREQKVVSFRKAYIEKLNRSRSAKDLPELDDQEEGLIEQGIQELIDLERLELPTIDISRSMNSKDVANIFVRINSAGQSLKQNDFILTLISVYDLSMKARIDQFCANSIVPAQNTSYNRLIEAKPSHIVKVASGLAFNRGRLSYVYKKMCGKLSEEDENDLSEDELRNINFAKFSKALDRILDINNWHSYLNAISGSGYVDKSFIVAENPVIYGYLFYLVGKYTFNVPVASLNALIRRWFFVSTITTYYSNSTETVVERQLNDLKKLHSAQDFIDYFNKTMQSIFTKDYFNITLLDHFNSSSPNSPYWYGFVASLVVLGTKALFVSTSLESLFIQGSSGNKTAYDKHHLFPKNYLASIGITDDQDRNQFANFTYIDYDTNIEISDKPPIEYVTIKREKLGEKNYKKMCKSHALPLNWEKMDYMDFLVSRRKLMVKIVLDAYNYLGKLQS